MIEVSTVFNLFAKDKFYDLHQIFFFYFFILGVMYAWCEQENVGESKNDDSTSEEAAKGTDASEVDADTPKMKPGIDHFNYEETDPIKSSALSKCCLYWRGKSCNELSVVINGLSKPFLEDCFYSWIVVTFLILESFFLLVIWFCLYSNF